MLTYTNPFRYLLLCLLGREHYCLFFFLPAPQGEIASCAGPMLYLWNMKGHLLTSTDASCGPQPDILCVLFTQRHEWDPKNVIATGCADGVIRVKSFLCVHVDYRTVSAWDESLEVLVNQQHLGCESIHACGSFPQCKLASTWVWAHTPQMGIIALLLP